ncbi:MAG TPA: iron-containing alcohol dehydrogenase [Thermoleophilaceae bacterium]|nr:iron-containing alcohol dehydrogenase [Thermoleophilaceae bacterium]
MSEDFTWVDSERLIRFGEGVAADAPALLAERGFNDFALLTTERAEAAAPGLRDAADSVVHVPPGQVPDVAASVRDAAGGHPLVALGGGRVVDAAKAIAAADGLPCAALPTTLSGAELTRIHRLPAGVTGVPLVRPSLVIADPALMASQPMPDLAATAMNALAHAVEALYVPGRNPVAEMAALGGAGLIARGFEGEDPGRGDLALGATLSGWALGATGYAVHHVVCQTLVRVAGTPHAETNAIVLPHVIAMMATRAPDVIGLLAEALGAGERDPAMAAGACAALTRRAGPVSLAEVGADEAALDAVAEAALARAELGNTPDPPGLEELRGLLQRAYERP